MLQAWEKMVAIVIILNTSRPNSSNSDMHANTNNAYTDRPHLSCTSPAQSGSAAVPPAPVPERSAAAGPGPAARPARGAAGSSPAPERPCPPRGPVRGRGWGGGRGEGEGGGYIVRP